MAYEGWVYDDGRAVCPHCNEFIPSDPEIPSVLRAIDAHSCAAGHVEARAGLASGTGGASQG